MVNAVTTRKGAVVQEPSIITKLLNHPLAAWLWLPIRVWLGWQWLNAGWEKLNNAAWVQTGVGLKGFLMGATKVGANGASPIHYAWYANFLKLLVSSGAYVWMAKIVTIGEMLVGIALILGMFTGFAAFFGGFMNFNYLMAGVVSVNPLFLVLAITLILAWKVSGYIGVDYFLVPRVGALWSDRMAQRAVPGGLPEGAKAR
jgi:thiosulfate dehydrogenase [quinone] large subunit